MMVDNRTEWEKLVNTRLSDHEQRLTEHEKEQAVYKALADEQRFHLNERFNRVQDNITQTKKDLTEDIASIKSGINRVTWAVGFAILAGITQFILRGGLIH
jgi:hypothetical protein